MNAFSRFEREQPKLESDARWEALATARERRAAFDDFCKNYGAEQKKLKEAREKSATAGFVALLDEAAAAAAAGEWFGSHACHCTQNNVWGGLGGCCSGCR